MEDAWFAALAEPWVMDVVDGVAFAPWAVLPIAEFRRRVPARYPIRHYADLCHVQTAQFPVDGWDLSCARRAPLEL